VNPIYAILESPHRWLILAGLSFLAGLLGTMMMLAYAWPHWLARVWFLIGLALAIYFLVQAFLDWNADLPAAPEVQRMPEAGSDPDVS
jgi:hypothetical protein